MTPMPRPRWTIAAAAAAVAVGVGGGGLALASGGGGDSSLPDAVSLQDRVPVTATVEAHPSDVDVVPAPMWRADGSNSLGSSISWSVDQVSHDSVSLQSISHSVSASFRQPATQPAPTQGQQAPRTPAGSISLDSVSQSPASYSPPSPPSPESYSAPSPDSFSADSVSIDSFSADSMDSSA